MEFVKFFFDDIKHFLALVIIIAVVLEGISECIKSAKNNEKTEEDDSD